MTDEEFLAALSLGTLDPAAFNHEGHIRAAYLILRAEPTFGRALDRIADLIKAFAARHGHAGLYHETITVAFMALINARLHGGTSATWAEFRAANSDLFTSNALASIYPPEQLSSPLAKQVFVLPDAATSPGSNAE